MSDSRYPDLTPDLVHQVAFALAGLPLAQWQSLPKRDVRAFQVKARRILQAERDYLGKKAAGLVRGF